MHKLNLPLPPSINDYYSHHCKFGYPTIFVKTKGKEYRAKVNDYITKNNLKLRANIPLELTISISPSSNRKWDLDNRLKCVLDSLTEASVWEDDSLIYKITMEKAKKSKNGFIEIEIKKYIN